MASTPMTAAPPDQNSCRPLRPNGNNISIEASPTPATTRPTWISEGRDLVPPLKVAVTKIDTAGSTHPKSTRGRGRRALASKATSAMRHANEPTRRWGSTAKANPLDTTIDPGSTSRRSRRLIAPIRDVCHAPSEDAEIMTTNARSSLWGGETGWCYQDLNCEVIHVSCTTLADPQRTPHRLATRRSPSRRQQTRLLVGVDRVGPTSTAAANSATRRPLTVVVVASIPRQL